MYIIKTSREDITKGGSLLFKGGGFITEEGGKGLVR